MAAAEANKVEGILSNLVSKLAGTRDAAVNYYKQDGSRRNQLAAEAAKNNYQEAKEIRMLTKAAVPAKLDDRYKHCKHWESKYADWGGHDNGYAEHCHREAKDAYYEAFMACKKLGLVVVNCNSSLVALFQNLEGLANKGEVTIQITTKEGYERDSSVSNELHSKISTKVKGTATNFASSVEGELGAEVASSIKSCSSVRNTGETTTDMQIKVDLSGPVFIYQQKFDCEIGDGSILSCWGGGYIISPKAIA